MWPSSHAHHGSDPLIERHSRPTALPLPLSLPLPSSLHSPWTDFFALQDYVCTAIFFVDMAVSFRLAYYVSLEEVFMRCA